MHQVLEVPGQLAVLMVSEETKVLLKSLSRLVQTDHNACMEESLAGNMHVGWPALHRTNSGKLGKSR